MKLVTGGGMDVMHDAHRVFFARIIDAAINEYQIDSIIYMLKTNEHLVKTRNSYRPYFDYAWRYRDTARFIHSNYPKLRFDILPYNSVLDTISVLNSESVIGASEYYTGLDSTGLPIIRIPEIGGHHSSDILSALNAASAQSPCHYVNIGAVLLRAGNIVATGFNNNDCDSCPKTIEWKESGKPNYNDIQYKNACNAIHAEDMVLENSLPGDDLILTHSPCSKCANLIIEKQIRRVVYLNEYVSTKGIDVLKNAGIQVRKAGL
jgi:dCMP deaminase